MLPILGTNFVTPIRAVSSYCEQDTGTIRCVVAYTINNGSLSTLLHQLVPSHLRASRQEDLTPRSEYEMFSL